ncbi:MAG: hypothetical protein DWQ31_08975 [Planctomycetota bacterium]|nr:MAG: hypothetical protein DWQ31_08975 [Planctomycetota bacterium]REJ91414.1 MAG: hypothetical protein DWQ35_14790 [Planctomycetota bacterium]
MYDATTSFAYDPDRPASVFIGPSLSKADARDILDANFYPPARMGDIYRLLGAGVELIVLIDGVFHQHLAVWQRELLEALEMGVTIVGASSMGALRAAELYPHGMIGHGQIFEWYREGVIDGDDEVALLHIDESLDYRGMSVPLVDIRYQLQRAVAAGIVEAALADEVIGVLKSVYFGDRTWQLVYETLRAQDQTATAEALADFTGPKPASLKAEDALSALKFAKAWLQRESPSAPPRALANSRTETHLFPFTQVRRGLYSEDSGTIVCVEDILRRLRPRSRHVFRMVSTARRRFYLRDWAKRRKVTCPPAMEDDFQARWLETMIEGSLDNWLRNNGLRAAEFSQEMRQRALETWILEQGPARFDLPAGPLSPSSDLSKVPRAGTLRRRLHGIREVDQPACEGTFDVHLRSLPFLLAWAEDSGINRQAAHEDPGYQRTLSKWQSRSSALANEVPEDLLADGALYEWLLHRGPSYFGYVHWGEDGAVANELRFAGELPSLVRELVQGD